MDATCCCPASDGGTAVIALVVATATAVVTGLQVLYGRKAAVSASSDHWASHLTKFLVDEILSCDRQRELFKQLARGGRTAEDDRRILTNLNESREDSLRRIHTLEVLWPDTARLKPIRARMDKLDPPKPGGPRRDLGSLGFGDPWLDFLQAAGEYDEALRKLIATLCDRKSVPHGR